MKKQLAVFLLALGLMFLVACQPDGIWVTVTPAITSTPLCEWPCTEQDRLILQAQQATRQMERTLTAQALVSETPTPLCETWPCPSDSLTLTAAMAETFTAIPSNTPPAGMTVVPAVGDLGWGSIYGVITDAITGKPIANAQVECHHNSYTTSPEARCSGRTWTNADGIYAFAPVYFHDTDTIILSIDAPGYQRLDFRVSALTTAALHANLGLEREQAAEISLTPTIPFMCTLPACTDGVLTCGGLTGCMEGCGMVCVPFTPSSTVMIVCTPPACANGVLTCGDPNGCPGGCGTICVTFTPTVATPPNPPPTYQAMCTPPACPNGTLKCGKPEGCPGGCGTICVTFTPTP